MKKLYVLLSALFIISCTPSNEDRAEKLVKETLKDYLYHPDSYEPISTRVDSMFVDVTTIDPIMEISETVKKLLFKIRTCKIDVELAESSMDHWAPNANYSDLFSGEYSRAKDEKEEANYELQKYTKKLSDQLAALKDNVAKYHKGEFTGWVINHRFRCLNGTGSLTMPQEMIFFSDEDFTTCTGYESYKLEGLAKLMKAVDEATSDDDIVDYFKDNPF